jgi:hypothetical protein
VIRPWLWAAANHTIGNRGEGDFGLLSQADVLDTFLVGTRSCQSYAGTTSHRRRFHCLEQLFWPTADEAGLLILVKLVFLNAILVGTGYYKPW